MLGRIFLVLIVVTGLVWLAGLTGFVNAVNALHEPPLNNQLAVTDGIVVLTGGSERLGVGIDLLKAGKGKKLLVSGVNPTLSEQAILAGLEIPVHLRSCCILLGRIADNTIGNAEESRTWIKAENFRSIRLVTANYHMPRSLYIFRRTLPDITIVPHPVIPDSLKLSQWWRDPETTGVLVREYSKYLLVLLVSQWELPS